MHGHRDSQSNDNDDEEYQEELLALAEFAGCLEVRGCVGDDISFLRGIDIW